MLSVYDLNDLHIIFLNIRAFPEYELNEEVLTVIINFIKESSTKYDINLFRIALRSIDSLDKYFYQFAFVDNVYEYFPPFLKDEQITLLLIECCTQLLNVVKGNNIEKIEGLADCLHNLPTFLVNNNYSIPENFWIGEVKYYRDNFDSNFLLAYEVGTIPLTVWGGQQ